MYPEETTDDEMEAAMSKIRSLLDELAASQHEQAPDEPFESNPGLLYSDDMIEEIAREERSCSEAVHEVTDMEGDAETMEDEDMDSELSAAWNEYLARVDPRVPAREWRLPSEVLDRIRKKYGQREILDGEIAALLY